MKKKQDDKAKRAGSSQQDYYEDSEDEDKELDIDGTQDLNYYKENIFNKEDYLLYRGIMHFYSGEYHKALQDLESSSRIMHANKEVNRIEWKFETEHNESQCGDLS